MIPLVHPHLKSTRGADTNDRHQGSTHAIGLDRRQGVDDRPARGTCPRGRGRGVQIIGFQELFYGPYFGIVQDQKYYEYAESIPGPTIERFQALAKELGLVIVLPIYEVANEGEYYNTAAVIDADGTLLGKYRKHHIPNLPQFWEKFYFRPGNLGYPVFDTAVGRVGVYICYDRHFPEGWRELGLEQRADRVQPVGHQARPVQPAVGDRAAGRGRGQPVLHRRQQPDRQESEEFGDEAVHFYGSQLLRRPARQLRRRRRLAGQGGDRHPRPRPRRDHPGPQRLAVLPRPPARVLRPDHRPVGELT